MTRHLTRRDILAAHAEFGRLDREAVKEAMGPNWPREWDRIAAGSGIFAQRARGAPE